MILTTGLPLGIYPNDFGTIRSAYHHLTNSGRHYTRLSHTLAGENQNQN